MKKIVPFLFYAISIILVWHTICNAQETYPQRIISLGPSITEELYLLEADDNLVGVTIYCQKPPPAQKKEKVGTTVEVNLEKIVSLKPDLVLATPLTDLKAKEKLTSLGIKVVTFSLAKNFNEVCEQFLSLGKLVGKEKKAEEIVNITKNQVDLIKNKVKNLPRPTVFIQVGTKPLFTTTKDDYINNLIELAGGINIACDLKIGLYSREKVIKENPDIIIIATMEIGAQEEKENWEKYKTLEAVKNDKIYLIDSYKLCSPTPVNFVAALEEIANILHSQK